MPHYVRRVRQLRWHRIEPHHQRTTADPDLVSSVVSWGVLIVIARLPAPPVAVRIRRAIRLHNHWLSNHGSDHRIAHTAKDEYGKTSDSDDQTANQKGKEWTCPRTCRLNHRIHLFALTPHLGTVLQHYGSLTGP